MAETNYVQRNRSQLFLLTILRVVLGAILLWKAINFIRDAANAQSYIEQTGIGFFSQYSETLAFVLGYLTLLCGFFIFVGLFTRASSIIQIPILIMAVFFVNIKHIDASVFEFVLSMITLFLLVLFAIKGSGALSADEYFRIGAARDKASASLR